MNCSKKATVDVCARKFIFLQLIKIKQTQYNNSETWNSRWTDIQRTSQGNKFSSIKDAQLEVLYFHCSIN